MTPITLRDVTQKKAGPEETLDSLAALKRWIKQHENKPLAFWDLSADTWSARFALGDGEAGGVMIASADGNGPYSYLIEGTATEELPATCDGYDMPIPGRERVTPERLLEVLSYLMEHEEVGPGKWDGDSNFTDSELVDLAKVDPGLADALKADQNAPPQAYGTYSQALITLLKQKPARSKVLTDVLALIPKAGDANFRAYLHAYAHHGKLYAVECGDWDMDTPELQGKEIFIGKTGAGDHYLMRGSKAIVVLHETGEEETYLGFEGLLSDLVFRAHDGGTATDLDAITGEEPY